MKKRAAQLQYIRTVDLQLLSHVPRATCKIERVVAGPEFVFVLLLLLLRLLLLLLHVVLLVLLVLVLVPELVPVCCCKCCECVFAGA